MIHYNTQVRQLYDNTYGTYQSYGITVSRGGKIIREIVDISTDEEKVNALVELYNKEQLSPAHLDEAIESFLYDFKV